jgi:hypothetical protein
MQRLRKVFETLTYQQLLSIAEEFYFHPDTDLPKVDFEKKFAAFLEAEGYADEVALRYAKNEDLEKEGADTHLKLLPFQCLHKRDMIIGCERYTTFLNTSEPGTGKTFMTLSYSETEKKPIAAVVPKSTVLPWYILAMQATVEVLFICNYEMLITGQIYHFSGNVNLDKLTTIPNPYLTKTKGVKGAGKTSSKSGTMFEWKNLPERTLFIFDEAHMCKNVGTQRTETLLSAYRYATHPENLWKDINIVLLSGTIIEKKENLAPFMYVLGEARTPNDKSKIGASGFSVKKFGQMLLAERRMTRATMRDAKKATGDRFTSDICAKKFVIPEEERVKIQDACEQIRKALKGVKDRGSSNHLAIRLQKRQEIEMIKLAIFFDETKKQLEAGYLVAVYLNFIPAHEAFCSMIRKNLKVEYSVIRGGQTAFERLKQVELWQKGTSKIIVVMIQAGGTGIGLHDVFGVSKRYALISPPESATQLIQALGRIDRLGSKSNSVQRIVFVANTVEEKIADSLQKKMMMMGDMHCDEDGSSSDSIFLYEDVETYVEKRAASKAEPSEDMKIEVKIDKKNKQFTVKVPDAFATAFEANIPAVCLQKMRVAGETYYFPLDLQPVIQEFLGELTL